MVASDPADESRSNSGTTGPADAPPGGDADPGYPSKAEVDAALERIRSLALALPEVTERLSHGSPTFFIRGKKTFANFIDGHHHDGRLALWLAAPDGVQATLAETEPERFFRPPYVGHRGWLGVRLDVSPDWDEIGAIIEEAYCCIAPKKLIAALDAVSQEADGA